MSHLCTQITPIARLIYGFLNHTDVFWGLMRCSRTTREILSQNKFWRCMCRPPLGLVLTLPFELSYVKWLHAVFTLTPREVAAKHRAAIGYLCSRGDLTAMKWFASTFRLTDKDMDNEYCPSLRSLPCNGNHYCVNRACGHESGYQRPLYEAVRGGHHELVEWLLTNYAIGMLAIIGTFMIACDASDIVMMNIITRHSSWHTKYIGETVAVILTNACIRGDLPVVAFICEKYDSMLDSQIGYNRICTMLNDTDNPEIVRLLAKRFGRSSIGNKSRKIISFAKEDPVSRVCGSLTRSEKQRLIADLV